MESDLVERVVDMSECCTENITDRFYLAQIHFSNNRLEEAAVLCRDILSERPHHSDALTLLGITTLQSGKPSEASRILDQALQIDTANSDAWCNLAISLNMLGDSDSAMSAFHKALKQNPNHLMSHYNLGWTLHAAGRIKEALNHYKKAVEISPDFLDAWNNMGEALRRLGETKQAIGCFRKALSVNEDHFHAENNLGLALLEENCLDEAAHCFRHLIEKNPGIPKVYNNLGTVHLRNGQTEEAITWIQKALALNPKRRDKYLVNLGSALQDLGRLQEAEAARHEAITFNPVNTEAWFSFSQTKKFISYDHCINDMETLLMDGHLSQNDQVNIHFALGKVFDDIGEYAKAFEHYAAANGIHRKTLTYDVQKEIDLIERIINYFDETKLGQLAESIPDIVKPIFVIGMPRSGTSLVEHILASHPDISGGGELPEIGIIARSLHQTLGTAIPFPECLDALSPVTACNAADQYYSRLCEISKGAKYVTDKATRNSVNLGLIAILFPNARIIHCVRNPLDNCLSCYFQRFLMGSYHTFDLTELGLYYRAHHRLMKHWESVLHLPFLEVRYELLVSNQEEESRRLVDFCDLEWDERCLEFHRTIRSVGTASNFQVRQPIYKTSVERWRNYAAFLDPLIKEIERADSS